MFRLKRIQYAALRGRTSDVDAHLTPHLRQRSQVLGKNHTDCCHTRSNASLSRFVPTYRKFPGCCRECPGYPVPPSVCHFSDCLLQSPGVCAVEPKAARGRSNFKSPTIYLNLNWLSVSSHRNHFRRSIARNSRIQPEIDYANWLPRQLWMRRLGQHPKRWTPRRP